MKATSDHERVDCAIKQLGSYGIRVEAAASAAAFTRGLDPAALQASSRSLFRTPPPTALIDREDLESAGGVQLAQACQAQEVFEQELAGCARSAREAADAIATLYQRTAVDVEDVVARFELQVEQSQMALARCPPKWIKSIGDTAHRTICEQRNKALTELADQLVQDCDAAEETAPDPVVETISSADTEHPEPEQEQEPEPVAAPELEPASGGGPEPVEHSTTENNPPPAEKAEAQAGNWHPDIWLAASTHLDIAAGADAVMPAGAGGEHAAVELETSFEASIERSGQW